MRGREGSWDEVGLFFFKAQIKLVYVHLTIKWHTRKIRDPLDAPAKLGRLLQSKWLWTWPWRRTLDCGREKNMCRGKEGRTHGYTWGMAWARPLSYAVESHFDLSSQLLGRPFTNLTLNGNAMEVGVAGQQRCVWAAWEVSSNSKSNMTRGGSHQKKVLKHGMETAIFPP